MSVAAAPLRGRTPRAASALTERCDVRSAVRLVGMARAGASPRDAAQSQERLCPFTGPRESGLCDGLRRRLALKLQRAGWIGGKNASRAPG